MIPIIDTHSHFYFPNIQDRADEILEKTRKSGVKQQILIGCDEISNLAAMRLAQKYADEMRVAIGIHPCDIDKIGIRDPEYHRYRSLKNYALQCQTVPEFFEWLENLFLSNKNLVVGFGETGFDRFHDDSPQKLKLQRESFENHVDLCEKYKKTLVIHSRSATAETLDFLEKQKSKFKNFNTIWHCFTEDLETAKKSVDLGIKLGIGGILTYPKSSELREVVKKIPLEFLVTETDCPFLVPQKGRKSGETVNHPGFLPEIIETIAELKNMKIPECAEVLYQNGIQAFDLD